MKAAKRKKEDEEEADGMDENQVTKDEIFDLL